ncbi:MAG TPA: hypothetical protein VGX25_05465 [Actinophytocola sp.]|uniref:hypothetical protein n=1 Tax=Actinophytocola sp. TaxID=1872138 RepID=UPI002DDC9452|nr:hypothetical protein [Actinophytocola sp.]HEV2778831.1 hypothetical protein [Actinophytocola sp.]
MTTVEPAAQTVQAVEQRANELIKSFDPIRFLLILLSIPFIVVGYVARLVYRVVLVVFIWAYSAAETGWKRAAPRKGDG